MAAAISSTWLLAARRGTTPLACSLSSSPKLNTRRLVLYSKPGCCLCDGLKEKLDTACSLSPCSDSLHDVTLQEILPRLSPRLSVEIIQKKLLAAFS